MKKLITLLLISGIALSTYAQQGIEAGGMIGVSHYFGDLNNTFRLNRPGLSIGVVGRYNFNTRLSLKFSANYGNISAYDSDSDNSFEQARNLSFRSHVLDGSLQFEFNFLPYVHGSKDEFFTPYIFGGFSIVNFDPEAEIDGQWEQLRSLGTEGQFRGEEYYSISGAFTYGIGFKIDLSYEWSLNIELAVRRMYTDYLDDVSGVYPDMEDLEALRGELAVSLSDRSLELPDVDAPIGQKGRQRGNSNNNDSYALLGVGLVYYFGDIRCPAYSR
ncbi:MAG: DUF6089 family protein [Bacteroidota bacterium]